VIGQSGFYAGRMARRQWLLAEFAGTRPWYPRPPLTEVEAAFELKGTYAARANMNEWEIGASIFTADSSTSITTSGYFTPAMKSRKWMVPRCREAGDAFCYRAGTPIAATW